DGGMDGLAGLALPQHRGLALVGDAERGHVPGRELRLGERVAHARGGVVPDAPGVVLDPARLRIALRQLALSHAKLVALGVEHDRPRAGGALVDRQQCGLKHWLSLLRYSRNARRGPYT